MDENFYNKFPEQTFYSLLCESKIPDSLHVFFNDPEILFEDNCPICLLVLYIGEIIVFSHEEVNIPVAGKKAENSQKERQKHIFHSSCLSL